jgi:hypothetical protein
MAMFGFLLLCGHSFTKPCYDIIFFFKFARAFLKKVSAKGEGGAVSALCGTWACSETKASRQG